MFNFIRAISFLVGMELCAASLILPVTASEAKSEIRLAIGSLEGVLKNFSTLINQEHFKRLVGEDVSAQLELEKLSRLSKIAVEVLKKGKNIPPNRNQDRLYAALISGILIQQGINDILSKARKPDSVILRFKVENQIQMERHLNAIDAATNKLRGLGLISGDDDLTRLIKLLKSEDKHIAEIAALQVIALVSSGHTELAVHVKELLKHYAFNYSPNINKLLFAAHLLGQARELNDIGRSLVSLKMIGTYDLPDGCSRTLREVANKDYLRPVISEKPFFPLVPH